MDEKLRQTYFWIVNHAIISPHYDMEFADGPSPSVNSIELTHVLSPLGLVAWQLYQDAVGAVTVEVHGPADLAAVESAAQSRVTTSAVNLARDAKPQRYSSLAGALVG